MQTTNPHAELRSLLAAAVGQMSESRAALGAGCHPSCIKPWLRRSDVQLKHRTVNQVLPNLRNWQDWVPGYLAAEAEIRCLEVEGMACWSNRVEELRARLEDAAVKLPIEKVALGCEVPVKLLLFWRLGACFERYTDDLIRALAHLRHIDSWPMPEQAEPTKDAAAATA